MANMRPAGSKIGEVFAGFSGRGSSLWQSVAVGGVSIGALVVCYGVLACFTYGTVPAGTSVAGVDIGALRADKAVSKLDSQLAGKLAAPLKLQLGAKTAELSPKTAGLQPDFERSVHRLTDFTLNPQIVFGHLFGMGKQDLQYKVDASALDKAVKTAAKTLQVPPVEAALNCVGSAFAPTEPKPGARVDLPAAIDKIPATWANNENKVQLSAVTVDAQTTRQMLNQVQDGLAKTVVSAPVKVKVDGKEALLSPQQLCAASTFTAKNDQLVLSMNGQELATDLKTALPDLGKPPVDAKFTFSEGDPKLAKPVIVPGRDGTEVNAEQLQTAVTKAAGENGARLAVVSLEKKAPQVTTKQLQDAGIKEIIGEFSTPFPPSSLRTLNLIKGTHNINGTFIKPGGEFSLLKGIGPLDEAHGWQASGVLVNGFHQTGLGGGLSQVSTTTYNAAFFAGMDLIAHTPHSKYFSRYPEGRESTLWVPTIDLLWKNPNPTAVLVQAWVGDSHVNVRIWGTKYYKVTTTTSPRYNVVSPKVRYSTSPLCRPNGAGNPGFTVRVERHRFNPDGSKHDDQSWVVTYQPDDATVCAPPPHPEAPKADDQDKDNDGESSAVAPTSSPAKPATAKPNVGG